MNKKIEFEHFAIQFDIDNLSLYVDQVGYGTFRKPYLNHCHGKNYYELHLVCGGRGTLVANGVSYPIEEGSIYMTGPEIYHEQIPEEGVVLEEYFINYRIHDASPCNYTVLTKTFSDTHFFIGKDIADCRKLFEMLSLESQERKIGYVNNVYSIIRMIFTSIVRCYTDNMKSDEKINHISELQQMNLVDWHLLHYCATITLEELSGILHMSPRHTQRFLRENYGKSFSQLRKETRLNVANNMIKKGCSMEEAAQSVGYSSIQPLITGTEDCRDGIE